MEGPIRVKELGDMTPEIPAAQSVRNQNRLSSKADLEILSLFSRKEMNTKVGGNFMPYNQQITHQKQKSKYLTSKKSKS
jgi:predicted PolB exonuclease-like 3'-5' exonuclease